MSTEKIAVELNAEIVAEINRLRAKIRERLDRWHFDAVAMDAIADECDCTEEVEAAECRERARTLRYCAKDIADIAK